MRCARWLEDALVNGRSSDDRSLTIKSTFKVMRFQNYLFMTIDLRRRLAVSFTSR
jgi:hypothetical protein